uniref:Uncharacterized protein n=1 Tax=uncultured Poseidoniia archaeon TaxID=1697135 RepID=A0A1B1TBR0_9ARCH|nr:hypothetical protein [uncultured Candidatus Thalassoarchaea sp.]
MSDTQGFIEGVCFLGFLLILIVFVFFQAAKPENKKIQTEKAPTIIEISWIFLLIVLTVSSSGILFIPALFFCVFLRMYFVKLYQLFNSDWRTDGTPVGIQSVENLGEVLDNLPTPEEITENIVENVVDFTINEYRDKNSPLNKIVSLILWIFSPIIEFHKKNHQKRWFVFYVYFIAIFVGIPLLFLSIFIGDLIDFFYNKIVQSISSFFDTF